MQRQMQVNYPNTLPNAISDNLQLFKTRARLAMAAKLYVTKRLSSDQAAELVGMERVEFLHALHQVETPVITLTRNDMLPDI